MGFITKQPIKAFNDKPANFEELQNVLAVECKN